MRPCDNVKMNEYALRQNTHIDKIVFLMEKHDLFGVVRQNLSFYKNAKVAPIGKWDVIRFCAKQEGNRLDGKVLCIMFPHVRYNTVMTDV